MTERITFTANAGLTVEADAEGERRVLAGIAVPWNEIGVASVGPVRFAAGSLDAGARPPVDRDHDRTRLMGRVTEASDNGQALHARVRVSSTPLGDETLALAADGAISGFSVTADPTEYRFEDDDTHGQVMVVEAAEWVGLAVTPSPALQGAQITRVAATRPDTTKEKPEMDVMTLVQLCAHQPEDRRRSILAAHENTYTEAGFTLEDVTRSIEAQVSQWETAEVETLTETQPVQVSEPSSKPLIHAGEYARHLLMAAKGSARSAAIIERVNKALPTDPVEAVLSNEDTTTNPGLLPPQFTSEILGGLPVTTPYTSNLVRRSGLPATGMSIVKPEWTALPNGDFYTAENTEPASTPANIGTRTVDVLSWANAVRASINLIERSDFGGYAAAYFEQATISFLSDKEARLIDDIIAAGQTAGTGFAGATPKAAIGAGVEQVISQQLDANGNFRGLMPEYAAIAPDVWGDLVETDTLDGNAFNSGTITWGSLTGSLAGLIIQMVPNLAAGGIIVGARAAVHLQDGSELQLRSTIVNTLSVELGINANIAIDVEDSDAIALNDVLDPL